MRRHQQAGQPVHQLPGQLTGGQQREDADRQQLPFGHADGENARQQNARDDCREQSDPAQIERQRVPTRRSAQGLGAGETNLSRAFQFRQTLVDQVVTDVASARIFPGTRTNHRCGARQFDRLTSHLALLQSAIFCDRFDCMAVAVAGGKIHPAIDAFRIFPQSLLDNAQGLDKLAPIQRAKHPQAADAVADGDLNGGLLLVLRLHQLRDSQARFGEALLDPGQRQGQGGAVAL